MAGSALAPRVGTDWNPIREAFVTRTPIPSYTELAGEFGLSVSAVSRVANEENWAEARLGRIQQQLKEAGASELILSALRGEGRIMEQARSVCAQAVSAAELIIQSIAANTEAVKDSTRATTLNNVCFALANLGRFIDSIGAVGMPRDLRNAKNAGQGENGQPWEKGMLQQISVTVQNIQAKAAEEAKTVSPVDPSKPADGF